METNGKRNFPCLVILLAAGLVIVLACGVAATLGIGTFFWLTQRTVTTSQSEPLQASSKINPQDAILTPTRGLVEIQDQAGGWSVLAAEMPISEGSRVRTGALSGAQLIFYNGSRATLWPNTEIAIEKLDFQDGRQVVVLTQSTGESDHQVVSSPENKTRYEVHTPAGSAEAKGTSFHVSVTPDQSAHFTVEEGSLAVSGQGESVVLEAGQTSAIYTDHPPTEPALRVSGEGVVTQTGATWVIDGQSYTVHEHTIIIGNPRVGDIVHVEGRLLADDTRLADLIVLLRTSPANRFTLIGVVEEIDEQAWTVAGQTIEIGENADIDPSIQEDDLVRVEGVILDNGALQAEKILPAGEEDDLQFEFTGVVETTGTSSWEISGIEVVIDGDTTIDDELKSGDLVRVRGIIQENGDWLARRITRAIEGDRFFEISGHIESIDPWKVAGVSFETRSWTDIEPGLELGDLVRVKGQVQEDGTWVAHQIERIQDIPSPLIVIIGKVISTDPWVVSGIPLNVTSETVIEGDIVPGMLVRVEISLLPDGTWQVLRITPLDEFTGIPGCTNLTATVISFDGNRLQLLGWPILVLGDEVKIDGELRHNAVVVVQVCFNEDGTFEVIQIIVIFLPEIDVEPPPVEGHKVTICHKPDKKKGGNTINISRSALPAHLGHGDYVGTCSR